MIRCDWALRSPLETHYHDTEWGRPLYDETRFFEKLVLESMQTGLSWQTILTKRENFRQAFCGFQAEEIAKFTEKNVEELLSNSGIIRNKNKITSTISNAQIYSNLRDTGFTFTEFFWNYVDGVPLQNQRKTHEDIPGYTPLSQKIAKDLKKMGFRYVGPTTVYSLMQSSGIVNDHLTDCFVYPEIVALGENTL